VKANANEWRPWPGSKKDGDQPQVVDTLGGRMHVRWDQDAAATPHGQLVFFAVVFGRHRRVRALGVSSARWSTEAAMRRTNAMCWAR
jgi:hypothetical protein